MTESMFHDELDQEYDPNDDVDVRGSAYDDTDGEEEDGFEDVYDEIYDDMETVEERLDELLETVESLLEKKQYADLRDLLVPLEAADIAVLFNDLDERVPILFRLLPKELAAEVFVELESDAQELLLKGFSNAELKVDPGEYELDSSYDYRALIKNMQAGSGATVTVPPR